MKEKIRRFFYGRYGIDTLGYIIVITSMVISVASSLIGIVSDIASFILWVLSYLLLAWAIFRMMSRNHAARRRENDCISGLVKPVKKWFKLKYNQIKDAKTHVYLKCPDCKNYLRLPKGRGEIAVTCPVCKCKFDTKT